MFTFSFGSAFAAALDTDVEAEVKAYVSQQAQAYYGETGKIAKAYDSIFNALTFDKDGYLTGVGGIQNGYVSKDVVKATLAEKENEAELAFAENVAKFVYDTAKVNDKATALLALDQAFQGASADTYTAEDITGVVANLTATSALGTAADLYKKQLKIEKDAASAALAEINPENYSSNINDLKIVVKTTGAYDAVSTNGSVPFNWASFSLSAGNMSAKAFVEALLADANAKINATPANATVATTDIAAVKSAVKNTKEAILGHKKDSTTDYFVAPLKTSADLKGDTSLADAKANAIAQFKAVAALKQMQLSKDLQDKIDALNVYSKLTTAQKEALDKLTKQKDELAQNFANLEDYFTTNINYKETTTDVNTYLGTTTDAVTTTVYGSYNSLGTDANGLTTATTTLFDKADRVLDDVAKLKADAELYKLQKDVNGQPYYDAAVLDANLADAIKTVYTTGVTYNAVKGMLADGNERKLIETKIAYKEFINGTDNFATNPKDSTGTTIEDAWNLPTATGTNSPAATVMQDSTLTAKTFTNANLYDKAQKAELKALVEETEKAIDAAKTIDEVEKIFVAAHDKYVKIATTTKHETLWQTGGKIAAAYNKAEYNKDLAAYAGYFVAKNDMTKYPDDVDTPDEILNTVAFPIVYEAYTVDELAGKVAEAKAAIDALKTTAEVNAERDAVEALIKALPKTVTVADKDAVKAAADARADYNKIPGAATLRNGTVLDAAISAYEAAAADVIDADYKALNAKKAITTEDEAAIKALRAAFDEHMKFAADYNSNAETVTPVDADIKALETKLSDAKVAAAKELMIKLPTNPTLKDKAQVEAARAAYEALTLAEKAQVVNTLPYKNLIDAEEALTLNSKTAVTSLKIKASSKATKGAMTISWKVIDGDKSAAKGYQVWRSTKANKGFKKMITTSKLTYKNTKNLKKGTTYYYKVRAYARVDGKLYFSDYSNKAYRKAK